MSEILRTVKLTDEQTDRIFSALECLDARFLSRLVQEFMMRSALEQKRAWSEVNRIANIDPLTETCHISYATNEIVVKKKSEEKPEGAKTWVVMEDE